MIEFHVRFCFFSFPSQIDSNDERRALLEELDKCRRQIDLLRKTSQNSFDDRSKLSTASVDSGFDANTIGMSSTFLSQSALQSELNEVKERERKLDENVNSLQKVKRKKENKTFVFSALTKVFLNVFTAA